MKEAEGRTDCALCGKERPLCDSHIIPEFLLKPGYDEKGRSFRFETKTGRRPLVQKGDTERLLCEGCEAFLNKYYDAPFYRGWYGTDHLPDYPDDATAVRTEGFNYRPFKLFHLSVLWRASVASGEFYKPVNLDSHEERIREMVWNGQPGEPDEYPVMGLALTHEGELAHGLIMSPAVTEHDDMLVYTMYYGGFEWSIGVGDDPPPVVKRRALTKEGTMVVPIREWTDRPLLRAAMREHASRRRKSDW